MNLRRTSIILLTLASALVLSACQPLTIVPTFLFDDPPTSGAPAFYEGPPEAWVEARFEGAWGYTVYFYAGVSSDFMTGPTDRWCGSRVEGATAVEVCAVDEFGPYTPTTSDIGGDPATMDYTKLITVYPGEGFEVRTICENVFTGQLGCPADFRTTVRTTDGAGGIVGDIEEGVYEG